MLVPNEMASAKSWLQGNVTGLSNVKAYVYPSGIEDSQTQGWAVSAGYEGARGGLTMNTGFKEVYALGVNLQDVTSLGISGLHNLTQTQITERIQALVFKSSVWGVPFGLFYHNNELTTTEAIANRDIVDEGKFKEGMGKIIDGTVQCLNASVWGKTR